MHLSSLHFSPHFHLLFTSQSSQSKKRNQLKCKTHNGIGDISTSNSVLLKLTKEKDDPVTKSISFYQEILRKGISPNTFTFPCLLKLLANSHSLNTGKMIHAHVIKLGFEFDPYIRNNVIRFYALCGQICIAQKLFDLFPDKDTISWTILVSGYSKVGLFRESVNLFIQMIDLNLQVDAVTVVTALSACSKLGNLKLAQKLHKYIKDNNLNMDVYAYNALMDMYANCGDITRAYNLFKKMPLKSIVSYNTIISRFVHAGQYKRALLVFQKMQSKQIKPDGKTLVSILNACTNLGALDLGRWVHVYMIRSGFKPDGFLGNALVDLYAKCGVINHAQQVFEEMNKRDVFSYTSLIQGFAIHGKGKKALNLFDEMLSVAIKPSDVTFIGVLTACSHAGLVKEGLSYFDNMLNIYGVESKLEHYGCVVDMLGRAGYLNRAEKFINEMPIEPDLFIWGSLLAACKIHGNIEMGERIMKDHLGVRNKEDGDYVLMSNLYTSFNRYYDSVQVRKEMRRNKVKKVPGKSWIEIDGVLHEFRATNNPEF